MARKVQMGEPDAKYAFMLHGPPGSSKTAMAQAAAKEMWRGPSASLSRPTRLIRITPADFTRFGEDRLDSEAAAIFTLLTHVRGAVILFDEVDDLLRKRDPDKKPTFMELIIPAMLNRLADLRESCPRQEVCYIFATNFIQNIEAALIRRGRLDAAIPVVYPDTESRIALVERRAEKLGEKGQQLRKLKKEIAKDTGFWPWLTIQDFLDDLCKQRSISQKEAGTLAERYRLDLAIPPYIVSKLCEGPTSRELLNEFLHYSFSGWSTLQEYKDHFLEELQGWGAKDVTDQKKVLQVVNQGAERWSNEGRPEHGQKPPVPTTRREPKVPTAKAA
jgi:hypothetical protein